MTAVFNGVFKDQNYETNIKAAYEICSTALIEKTNENGISITEFADYLYKYVKILRVPLPDGIDLNHYFEIMNSRGEQLEKHEILKAKLMECFNSFEKEQRDKYFNCFNLIWEACSNMEKYVQYGFTTEQRHLIFGENNWNTISVYYFDELVNKIAPTLLDEINSAEQSIDEIINGRAVLHKEDERDDNPERFNSVVNFQNFLLNVLRVQTAKDEVALDDKRLIDIFEEELPATQNDRVEFVKEFIYNLLKCKFLFDKYIIKREFAANTDRWSLKSLKWYSVGKVHKVEQILDTLDGVAIKHLRPGLFYINFFFDIAVIKSMGVMGNNYGAETTIAMAHPKDIAAIAAQELQASYEGKGYRYVVSDELKVIDAVKLLGAAIGKPELPWVKLSDEQLKAGMIAGGMSEAIANLYVEMGHCIDSGVLFEDFHKQPQLAGKIRLKDFATDFAAVYNAS